MEHQDIRDALNHEIVKLIRAGVDSKLLDGLANLSHSLGQSAKAKVSTELWDPNDMLRNREDPNNVTVYETSDFMGDQNTVAGSDLSRPG